ncbi:hypothetical protein A3H03_03725 [Candidatus Kuenenbacteria bacterium RIFCSPLOWO2_12_FULL_42_13]|uniref:NADPH-dependent FMN reductase-like domain-containing protein n=1 Tax=Candidatus Kuenenbacteria bacterium RIFCSPLOWO2_12_FULL_42_13 TaxID=1798565 RepID=A0A1F6G1P6_9BACT|nr:MAG: hypothetical protein A3H03_03725 [Candidatus Kuenenbacteria bacterium RIFCSPLOWO2_12_FULL_42_13]
MSKKILLVSGSPRKGNTEYVLRKIYAELPDKKELLLLREKKIGHCQGCLKCEKTFACVIRDEMRGALKAVEQCDFLVIGTPRYYDNISGLFKDFIDRLLPLDYKNALKGKKIFMIMVGGESAKSTEKYLKFTMAGFVKYMELDLAGTCCFRALNQGELEKNPATIKKIKDIVKIIIKSY